MDFSALLLGEIDKKKQESEKYSKDGPIKAGEIERRKREEIELKERELEEQREKKRKEREEDSLDRKAEFLKRRERLQKKEEQAKLDMTDEEINAKLKEFGQPALEGETDLAKYKRLKKLLKVKKREEDIEKEDKMIDKKEYLIDSQDVVHEQAKVTLQIRAYIRVLLNEWTTAEPDNPIASTAERNLDPLLNILRNDTLDEKTFSALATTLVNLQHKSYRAANESYMSLSIGDAAWPVGVTAVGIHSRSNLSKITGDQGNGANIMKSETTRLWVTAIKRLVGYCESSKS